ncbi:MAG: aromatic ring-hydroxylating dioxygenase subunit alpha [Sphingomonas sp.]|nr:aromatic ring-hydroxylating dioxygenase subunit alpha [Sphingomonas sp.]
MIDGRIEQDEIDRARAALERPLAEAEGLPGRFYGPDFYKLEQQSLFPKSWCAVAVGAMLPNAGDLWPINLAGWQLLLTRTADGTIRAFHNICRHRAMQLVSTPCNAPRITCPWHAWTYDLKGNLLAMPQLGGQKANAVEGFDKAALGLKEIPVGRWLDYVFVNIDGQAGAFDDYIAPLGNLLAHIELERLQHGGRLTDIYAGNWKLATEGGIEDYHLPFAHPQLNAHLYRNTTPYNAPGIFAGGGVAIGAPEVEKRAWNAKLPNLVQRDGQPLSELYVFNVFPTGTVLISADHVMLGMLLPTGDSETIVDLHLYFDGDAATAEALADERAGVLEMWHGVVPQDFPFIVGTQATVMSRDAAGIRTRFSPYWEQAVFNFQKMVLDAVSDRGRGPAQ